MSTVEERIWMIFLIEKMYRQKGYSDKLGLEDISRFHGERVCGEEEKKVC